MNEGLYEVIFDDDALGEEESIDISRVVLLANICGGNDISKEAYIEKKQVTMHHLTSQ